jgi:hypothetical protein
MPNVEEEARNVAQLKRKEFFPNSEGEMESPSCFNKFAALCVLIIIVCRHV